MSQRRHTSIAADFPGAACPPRSTISFAVPGGREHRATVTAIRTRSALAIDDAGVEWNIPYSLVLSVDDGPVPECTLREVETLGKRLVSAFQANGTLPTGWVFGFDLATSSAPVSVGTRNGASICPSAIVLPRPVPRSRTPCCTKSPTPLSALDTTTTPSGKPRLARSGAPVSAAIASSIPRPGGSASVAAGSSGSDRLCSAALCAIGPAASATAS